jgi:hypothetical protein
MQKFTEWSGPVRIGTTPLFIIETPSYWEIGQKGSGWILELETGKIVDVSLPAPILSFMLWIEKRCSWRWVNRLLIFKNIDLLCAAAVHDPLTQGEIRYDDAFASAEFRRAMAARGWDRELAWVGGGLTFIWTGILRPLSESVLRRMARHG